MPHVRGAAELEAGGCIEEGLQRGKGSFGAVLLGPIGLVGGALGKKKQCYYCGKCGFNHEY